MPSETSFMCIRTRKNSAQTTMRNRSGYRKNTVLSCLRPHHVCNVRLTKSAVCCRTGCGEDSAAVEEKMVTQNVSRCDVSRHVVTPLADSALGAGGPTSMRAISPNSWHGGCRPHFPGVPPLSPLRLARMLLARVVLLRARAHAFLLTRSAPLARLALCGCPGHTAPLGEEGDRLGGGASLPDFLGKRPWVSYLIRLAWMIALASASLKGR